MNPHTLTSLVLRMAAVAAVLTGSAAVAQSPAPFGQLTFGNQGGPPEPPVVQAALAPLSEKTCRLDVTVVLSPGTYIYSMSPTQLKPTEITVTEAGGLTVSEEGFSPDRAPELKKDEVLNVTQEEFFGNVTWSTTLSSDTPLRTGLVVQGELTGMYCSTGQNGVPGQCVPILSPLKFSATLNATAEPGPAESPAGTAAAPSEDNNVGGDTVPEVIPPSSRQIAPTHELATGEVVPIRFDIALVPETAAIGDTVTLSVTAETAENWHTYSITMAPESLGGTPTVIALDSVAGLDAVDSSFTASAEPEINEEIPGFRLEEHHGVVTWSRRFILSQPAAAVQGSITYQTCDDGQCLPPETIAFAVGLRAFTLNSEGGTSAVRSGATTDSETTRSISRSTDTADVTTADTPDTGIPEAAKKGLIPFILTGMATGFLALLTPCVFPMVPIMVGFFLKQGEKGRNPAVLSLVFCASIILGFTLIGITISALHGAGRMEELANNVWINLLLAAIFFAFALMLMGVFEIQMPSWLLTWSSTRETGGGMISAMFMALTFVLVSFTCTFAFVGTLMTIAAKGHYIWPAIGMLSYSSAFAAPFLLFALMPSLMKRLPKSGGWLNTIKVTIGLLELALVIKFLSVADISWNPNAEPYFLDYTTVMTFWSGLAFVIALYLLGVFRVGADDPAGNISPGRAVFGTFFAALGVMLAAGVFASVPPSGFVWENINGFAPPRDQQIAVASHGPVAQDPISVALDGSPSKIHDGLRYALRLEDAVAVAQETGKPIFVDFTGVNCLNCRKMEVGVLSRPSVHSRIAELPRVQLYLDKIPGPMSPDMKDALRSRNIELVTAWQGGFAMPSYALVAPDGETVLANVPGSTDLETFEEFLAAGQRRWEEMGSSETPADAENAAAATTTSLFQPSH